MTNDVSMTALRQPSATSVLATNSAVVDYSRIHHRTTELVASAVLAKVAYARNGTCGRGAS
jgi:hypothetical protein